MKFVAIISPYFDKKMEKKPLNAENMGKGPRRPRFLVRLISRESISKLLYPKRVVSWSKSRKGMPPFES